MKNSNMIKLASASVLTVLLTSCGGGGGGGTTTTTTINEPTTVNKPVTVSEPTTVKLSQIKTYSEAGTKTIIDGDTEYKADLKGIWNKKLTGTVGSTGAIPNISNTTGFSNGVHSYSVTHSYLGSNVTEHNILVGRTDNAFALVGQKQGLNSIEPYKPFLISTGIKPTQLPLASEVKFNGQAKVYFDEVEVTVKSHSENFGKEVTIEATGDAVLTANFDRNDASIYLGQMTVNQNDYTTTNGVESGPVSTTYTQNFNQNQNLGQISGNKISGSNTWQIPSLVNSGQTIDMKVESSGGLYGQNGSEANVAFQSSLGETKLNGDGTATGTIRSYLGVFQGTK